MFTVKSYSFTAENILLLSAPFLIHPGKISVLFLGKTLLNLTITVIHIVCWELPSKQTINSLNYPKDS